MVVAIHDQHFSSTYTNPKKRLSRILGILDGSICASLPCDTAVDGRPLAEGVHGLPLLWRRNRRGRQAQLRVGLVEGTGGHRRRRRRPNRAALHEAGGYELEVRVVISAAGVSATDTGPPLPAPLMPPPRKSSSFGGELGRGAPLLLLEITCSRAQRHAEHLVNRRNTETRKPTRNRTAGAPGLKMWIQEKQQERCERVLTVVSEGEVEGQANAQILELKLLPQNITNRDEILAKDGWS